MMRKKQRALGLFRGKSLEDILDWDLNYSELKYLLQITEQTDKLACLKQFKSSVNTNLVHAILNPHEHQILEQEQGSPTKSFKPEDLQAKVSEYGEIGVESVASFLDDQDNIGLDDIEQSMQLLGDIFCLNELKQLHDMCYITYSAIFMFIYDQ